MPPMGTVHVLVQYKAQELAWLNKPNMCFFLNSLGRGYICWATSVVLGHARVMLLPCHVCHVQKDAQSEKPSSECNIPSPAVDIRGQNMTHAMLGINAIGPGHPGPVSSEGYHWNSLVKAKGAQLTCSFPA